MEKEPLGKQIIETGRATRKAFENYFAVFCDDLLKPIAGRVFGYLAHHSESSSQDIQHVFGLSKATVSECLSLLIERGYISYEKSEKDGREKTIRLTKQGLARSQRYHEMVSRFEALLTEPFTEEEQEVLSKLLEKVRVRTEEISHGE